MSLLTWLILGLVAGVIANLVSPEENASDFFGILILSVLGSVLGGFLANLIFGASISIFNLPGLLVAVMGSVALIVIPKFIAKRL